MRTVWPSRRDVRRGKPGQGAYTLPITNAKHAVARGANEGGSKRPPTSSRPTGNEGAKSMSETIRVALADDHPVVRSGIRGVLEVDPAIEVVGEAKNGEEARAMVLEHKPDVLLLDLSMPGPPVTETIEYLKQHSPETRVVILTAHDEDTYIRRVLRAGVSGYLLKDEAVQAVVKAVHAVHQGAAWFSESVAERFMQWQFGREPELGQAELTKRESELLSLIAKGWDNARIAQELGLAEQTIRNYTSTLYDKIGVHSRAEAVVWARERGFADL